MKLLNVVATTLAAAAAVALPGCSDNEITFPASPTPIPTATATPLPLVAPVVNFVGVIRADDTLVPQSGTNAEGIPIFERAFGSGFSLVVEGRPGSGDVDVGESTFETDLKTFPDLQIQVDRPLGDGDPAVCESSEDSPGGVPAIDPPSFEPTQFNIDALNDFGCRFVDGFGAPAGRLEDEACVQFDTGEFGFVDPTSTIQFCGFVNSAFAFPSGDTLVTVRLRDQRGNVGHPSRIILRVQP
jgi:hypothetical protein